MTVIMHKRLLTVKEASTYLSISKSKLYLWAQAGKVVSHKIDGCRRFDVIDLDAFIDGLAEEE